MSNSNNNSDGFLLALCRNDNFATCLPWTITISIIIPTIVVSIVYYNALVDINKINKLELELKSKTAELDHFKSMSEKERLISLLKEKSVLDINYLLEKK